MGNTPFDPFLLISPSERMGPEREGVKRRSRRREIEREKSIFTKSTPKDPKWEVEDRRELRSDPRRER